MSKRARSLSVCEAMYLGHLIVAALQNARGCKEVADVERYLGNELERGRFNSARAREEYAAAVDNAVWACLRDMPSKRQIYRRYKASGLRETCAHQLTDAFSAQTGAKDQRPRRWLLRGLLGS